MLRGFLIHPYPAGAIRIGTVPVFKILSTRGLLSPARQRLFTNRPIGCILAEKQLMGDTAAKRFWLYWKQQRACRSAFPTARY
jgi:hypothetical protein